MTVSPLPNSPKYEPSFLQNIADRLKQAFGVNDITSPLAQKPDVRVMFNTPQPTSTPMPTPEAAQYTPTPMVTPSSQYSSIPTEAPKPQDGNAPYTYFDKASMPEEYRPILDAIPNGKVVGSVIAQETGGFGYKPTDPMTGKIVDSWEEAKAKKIVGKDGEVGVSQIIPKWYWKDAGFPSEEAYADALYDPAFAISEAGRIINKNLAIYGDMKTALSHWNKSPSYPDEILNRIGIPIKEGVK